MRRTTVVLVAAGMLMLAGCAYDAGYYGSSGYGQTPAYGAGTGYYRPSYGYDRSYDDAYRRGWNDREYERRRYWWGPFAE